MACVFAFLVKGIEGENFKGISYSAAFFFKIEKFPPLGFSPKIRKAPDIVGEFAIADS